MRWQNQQQQCPMYHWPIHCCWWAKMVPANWSGSLLASRLRRPRSWALFRSYRTIPPAVWRWAPSVPFTWKVGEAAPGLQHANRLPHHPFQLLPRSQATKQAWFPKACTSSSVKLLNWVKKCANLHSSWLSSSPNPFSDILMPDLPSRRCLASPSSSDTSLNLIPNPLSSPRRSDDIFCVLVKSTSSSSRSAKSEVSTMLPFLGLSNCLPCRMTFWLLNLTSTPTRTLSGPRKRYV